MPLQMQALRLSSVEREGKTQMVYRFITSENFRQQLGKVDQIATKLGEVDVADVQAHQGVWKKRGQLIISLRDAHAEIDSEDQRDNRGLRDEKWKRPQA